MFERVVLMIASAGTGGVSPAPVAVAEGLLMFEREVLMIASAGTMIARKASGRKTSGSPMASAASAAAGSIGTALGGALLGRFARGLLGGLLR